MNRYVEIEILILFFFIFIGIFTCIYAIYMPILDAFYTAVSLQTFTGTHFIEKSDPLKYISCFQMIITYVLISIVFYNLYYN